MSVEWVYLSLAGERTSGCREKAESENVKLERGRDCPETTIVYVDEAGISNRRSVFGESTNGPRWMALSLRKTRSPCLLKAYKLIKPGSLLIMVGGPPWPAEWT